MTGTIFGQLLYYIRYFMEYGDLLEFLIFFLPEGIYLYEVFLENRCESIDSSAVYLEYHAVEGWCDASLLQVPDTPEDILDRLSSPHTWFVWIVPGERSEDLIEDPRCRHSVYRPRVTVLTEQIPIASEDLIPEAMKCMDRYTIRIRSDHASQAISHIASRIVGEGETENIGWEIVSFLEDIRYTSSEDLCLATPRSGNHEDWSIYSFYGFSLPRIE